MSLQSQIISELYRDHCTCARHVQQVFSCNAQTPALPAGLGSSSPLLLLPPSGVAAAMMPNLAKVVSQSYRKPKVVFWYKT